MQPSGSNPVGGTRKVIHTALNWEFDAIGKARVCTEWNGGRRDRAISRRVGPALDTSTKPLRRA